VEFIDLKTQLAELRPAVDRRIAAVLAHGQFIMGPEVAELEAALAAFVGVRHCVTLSSGTDALLAALMALGIGPGQEVITTAFTYAATAEAIVLAGARPVFVDVTPASCNIDADLIAAKVTQRTRAIMPVSLFGQPADLDVIKGIADQHGLVVIEDAAQSFGATLGERRSGALTIIGATSFFPSKPLGCYGDGGAAFTNEDTLATSLREIRVHGQTGRNQHARIGLNARLDTIQAAVLLAKLEHFEWELHRRVEVARRYHEHLGRDFPFCGLDELPATGCQLLPLPPADRTSVFAQFTVLVEDRDRVAACLGEAGIPTAVYYPRAVPEQSAYAEYCCPDCVPTARRLARHVLSLPMSAYLTQADQDHVCATLRAAVRA
jgi:UDP-2-acetamido-2-deoxy-ribo-hexuluronate aminotransferase